MALSQRLPGRPQNSANIAPTGAPLLVTIWLSLGGFLWLNWHGMAPRCSHNGDILDLTGLAPTGAQMAGGLAR